MSWKFEVGDSDYEGSSNIVQIFGNDGFVQTLKDGLLARVER
jgi:hypothetical protein